MIDDEVVSYINAIDPARRALFDRVHGLIFDAFPNADVIWSYKMPTYLVGDRRLHVAVWRHGVSFYGWRADADGGLLADHPQLKAHRSTLQLRERDAATITDAELHAFFAATFAA